MSGPRPMFLLAAGLLAAAPARAQVASPAVGNATISEAPGPTNRATAPQRRVDPRESTFRRSGDVDASDALDEILDALAADVVQVGAPRVSPLLLERVRVSPNLDPALADVVEARLAASLLRLAGAAVVRCPECDITRAEVVDSTWVVSRGITRAEQARAVAERHGARALLRAALTANTTPAWMALDVEIVRAEDGTVVHAESYWFGGENAALWRGVDRAASRAVALKELEARLEQRPIWSVAVDLGAAAIQAEGLGGSAFGVYGALRIDERFGEGRRHRIGLIGGGFSNPHVAGGIVQVSAGTRLSSTSVWAPAVELGAAGGAFIGGGAGNAPLFTGTLEYRPAVRIGIHATLGYLSKFYVGAKPPAQQLPDGELIYVETRPLVGGLFTEAGVTFSW